MVPLGWTTILCVTCLKEMVIKSIHVLQVIIPCWGCPSGTGTLDYRLIRSGTSGRQTYICSTDTDRHPPPCPHLSLLAGAGTNKNNGKTVKAGLKKLGGENLYLKCYIL